jgi:hypothetical protein
MDIIMENELYPNMKMEDDLSSASFRNLLITALANREAAHNTSSWHYDPVQGHQTIAYQGSFLS